MADDTAAAPPILGSALLTTASTRSKHLPPPASCGAAAIDAAVLDGGFRHGEITALAGAPGTGKTALGYHAVASHLLAGGGGEVAVVDTTGGFSPGRLRDVVVYRVRARGERRRGGGDGDGGECVREAEGLLERVRVMRVFDLVGVVEAVGEIGEMWERRVAAAEEEEGEVDDGVMEKGVERRREVGDSAEESDEEVLGDRAVESDGIGENKKIDGPAVNDAGIGMIIIDTITNVASSVVSKSPVQGQALLVSSMRSLQHLTSRHQICTILVNSAVGLNPSPNPEYHRRADDNVSIFSSILGKPALGKAFTYLVDTSIFLSMLPKTREDAATAYGDSGEGRQWQTAIVVEVLKDRYGAREGRWTAFEVAAGVKIVPCYT